MERALHKLAKQLRGLDEASLMSLWPKYAEAVKSFEPSQKWEDDVLVLCLIQAVRFKNQLFNYHWADVEGGEQPGLPGPLISGKAGGRSGNGSSAGIHPESGHAAAEADDPSGGRKGKVLAFPGATKNGTSHAESSGPDSSGPDDPGPDDSGES